MMKIFSEGHDRSGPIPATHQDRRDDLDTLAFLFLLQLPLNGLFNVLKWRGRSNLDIGIVGHRVRAALQPGNGFFHRFYLPNPVAGYQLLGFSKRPVRNDAVLRERKPPSRAKANCDKPIMATVIELPITMWVLINDIP